MCQSILHLWIVVITRNQEFTIALRTSIQCERMSLALTVTLKPTLNTSGAVFGVFLFFFEVIHLLELFCDIQRYQYEFSIHKPFSEL